MKRLHVAFSLLSVVLLAIMNCTTDPISTAGGTETGDAMVTGMMVDANGNPVKGATVRMVPVGFDARQLAKSLAKTRSLTATELRAALLAAVDSAVTDSNGQYSFDTVDAGTYNVLADSGATTAFQDSVAVEPDTQTTVPTDTLKAPGSVRGVVGLQPGHDSRTVFLIALGTFAVTAPTDTIGNFALANMAEGTYSTRILSTRDDYGVLDTAFSVTAGIENVLADTIALPYIGIPIPQGLSIAYDTLTQLVTLTWNTPTTGRPVQGYNVYRKHQDSTSFQKIAGVVADTFFVDSTALEGQTYGYRVAAVDTNQTEGTMSIEASVVIAEPFVFAGSFGAEGTTGTFINQHGVCYGLDSLIVVADKENSTIKVFDTSGTFLYHFSASSHVWDVALSDSGYIFTTDLDSSRIQKFDLQGNLLGSWGVPVISRGIQAHLAINDTILYVSFVYSSEVISYSTNGDSLESFVLPTEIAGLGYGGWDIAVDATGQVLIPVNNTVYVYDQQGNLLNQFQIVPGATTTDPRAIAADSNGLIFVCLLNMTLVYVYDSTGNYVAKFGGAGNTDGKFLFFSSMAIDNSNSLYISDGDLGRIQKFTRR